MKKTEVFAKINLLFIFILFISCSNYKATDPFLSGYGYDDIYSIPENVDPKYLIKADTQETDIENIMQQYFNEYGSYIIFLSDNKDNITQHNTITTINNIIKKEKYRKGVALDLSRTDMDTITANSFANNNNLVNIKLPNTITSIGENAFGVCKNLRKINFPSSITEIGKGAFKTCYTLISADLQNTKITEIKEQTFYDCPKLQTVLFPDSVTIIGITAFNYCLSLTYITLPPNITTIERSAFAGCRSIKSIKLNDELTTIYNLAFDDCTSLEKISLPRTLTQIQKSTFSGCKSLKSIEYLGDNSAGIKVIDDSYPLLKPATPNNLYLPNVSADPLDGNWDNFLGYNWTASGNKINYNTKMP